MDLRKELEKGFGEVKYKTIVVEPSKDLYKELLLDPEVVKRESGRVICTGSCDESIPSELSFGQMAWSTLPRDERLVFFANGFACHSYDYPHPSSNQALVGRRLNNRLKHKPNIHSIFVTRKPK